MSDSEEGKLGYAGVGEKRTDVLSEEDKKLLDAFHQLHVKPNIDSVHDLEKFMRKYGTLKKEKEVGEEREEPLGDRHGNSRPPSSNPHQYPRFSQFYGEGSKGEVTWETFKFEVGSVQIAKTFTEEQILHGIRRAVKGEASDIVRRLGTTSSLEEVMGKLQSTYGHIDSKETVLKKFYSCTQQGKETVTTFASRLEELFAQACDLNALRRTDNEILKQVLYQGLRKDLKQMSVYQCHTVEDYDRFKMELRKIEAELDSDRDSKPCKPVVPQESTEKSELGEVKTLLVQLNERIQKLEEKSEASAVAANIPRKGQNMGGGRKNYPGQGGNVGQDRRGYKAARPLGSNTFQPTCYNCQQKGHLARDCWKESTRKCYKCNKPDHIARNCPN